LFSLKEKPLVDGMAFAKWKNLSDEQKRIKKAIYISVKSSKKTETIKLICIVLKYKKWQQYCRVDISVMPKYNKRAGLAEMCQVQKGLTHHMQTRASIENVINTNIVDLDSPLDSPLADKTVRDLLLGISLQSQPLKKALLAIDLTQYGDPGISLTFAKMYAEEVHLLAKYPEVYLINLFPVAQKHMTPDAVEVAINVDWDENAQRPVLMEENLAAESLVDGENEWQINNLDFLHSEDKAKPASQPEQKKKKPKITPTQVDPETNSLGTFGRPQILSSG
jgi:hypothetical protein